MNIELFPGEIIEKTKQTYASVTEKGRQGGWLQYSWSINHFVTIDMSKFTAISIRAFTETLVSNLIGSIITKEENSNIIIFIIIIITS